MIIITGLGRCGTSFLTCIFKEAGFGVGNQYGWHHDVKAGMELNVAYAISRDMFTDHICQKDPETGEEVYTGEIPLDEKTYCPYYWHREISFREKILSLDRDTPPERNEKVVEIFKDPRITWHPKIIRAWWEVRKDLKLIILHRKPENVIRSREDVGENKNDFLDPKRGKHLNQFKEDFCDFMTEVLRLGIPYTIFFYPNFVTYDPTFVNSKLIHELGIDLESKGESIREIWDTVYDPDKVTYYEGEEETCVHRTAKTAMKKF